MRALALALALLVPLPGLAQEVGASLWLTEDAETTRFADAPTPGPPLDADDKVTVLFVEGDNVRVRKGDRYGWVAAALLTDVPPEPATTSPTPAGPPATGEFDLGELEKLLERTRQE